MDRKSDFDPAAQRYIDGEAPPPDGDSRVAADRFADLVDRYSDSVEPPAASLDAAVMARIEARRPSPSIWRRLSQPLLRPLPAAAVLALALATGVVLGRKTAPPGSQGNAVISAPQEILVRFELNAPGASDVSLAGSFNEWDGTTVPLVRDEGTSTWTTVIPLHPGQHEYMFVIDGERWVVDPDAQAQVDDGFGNVNSVVVVGPRGVASS